MESELEYAVRVDFVRRDPRGGRAEKAVSFPFEVRSMADVPQVGDQFIMPTWNRAENRDSAKLVKVVARRIGVSLGPGDMHRSLDSMYVEVMVDDVPESDPKF